VTLPLLRDCHYLRRNWTQLPGWSSHGRSSFAQSRLRPLTSTHHATRWHQKPLTVSSAEIQLEAGVLLEYVASSGQKRLGCAIKPDGKKNWLVEDQNGVMQSVAPRQISYVLGPSSARLAESTAANRRKDENRSGSSLVAVIEAECEARVAEFGELLEVAWEIVIGRKESDGGSITSLEEIADLVFGDSSLSSMYASHVLLSRDRLFFKEKVLKGKPVFEAKSEKLVVEARSQADASARKEEEERAVVQAILDSVISRDPSELRSLVGESLYSMMVAALEIIALDYGSAFGELDYDDNPICGFSSLDEASKAAARQVLQALGKPVVPSSAFNILVAWNIFTQHENLVLRRDGLREKLSFSSNILETATELTKSEDVSDRDATTRLDLTRLVSYAIDSSDTTEVDDALTWDAAEDKVWVHVADPTRYFSDGWDNVIFSDARNRGTTVYLPSEKFTMFPPELSSLKFSLGGAHSDGSALSFGFKILDNGALDESSVLVSPSRVSPPIRLTYEEVDKILSTQSGAETQVVRDLEMLFTIAETRQGWRVEQGALVLPSPFSRISVEDALAEEPCITTGLENTDTASWKLVSELMITACAIAGNIGAQNNIPLPYRGQEGFDYPSAEALEDIPEGPARLAAIFKSARSSEVRSSPLEHASLAMDAYVQITSPIRRSVDLIGHYQLKAVLRGESLPLDSEAMDREINKNLEICKTAKALENRTTKYWHLEYLRRCGLNAVHDAVYVRPRRDGDERLGVVEMCETGFQAIAQLPTGIKPGTVVHVRFSAIDPRGLSSRAVAVSKMSTEETELALKENDDFIADIFSDIADDEEFP
jgi:exoribonuclease II